MASRSKSARSTPPAAPATPPPANKPKVDLKLLSQHLKLSRTTISLVLNDAPHAMRLSAETRERVKAAAEEFGYKPNYFARSLSGKRSKMVGVLAPDFGEGYDAVVLTGIESCLLDAGYMYFVSSHLWSEDVRARSLQALEERGAEGVLLLNTPMNTESALPAVGIGSVGGAPNVPLVTIDNEHGMHLTFEHLVGLGHREIAVLKGHEASADTEARWEAAQRSAQRFGVPLDVRRTVQLQRLTMEGSSGIDEGYIAAETLLRRRVPFTAIVCFNDMSACGAMNAIRDAGLRPGEDVSVIGFDDIPIARIVHPTLTTIRQPLRDMGEQAARMLIELIEDREHPPEHAFLHPELIVRGSTGASPQRPVRAAHKKTPVAR